MKFPKLPKRGGARLESPKEKAANGAAVQEKPPKKKPEDMMPEELAAYRQQRQQRIIIGIAIAAAVILSACAIISQIVKPPEQGEGPSHLGPNVTFDPQNPNAGTESWVEPPEGMETAVGQKEGWYTFLVCGTDASDALTDTIMLVSYNTKDNELAVMSIPRDTMVNVSWEIKRINSVYAISGMEAFKGHVADLTGIYPKHHVFVDLEAFKALVNAIDGVEFDVPVRMKYSDPYQDLYIDVQPGVQILNGQKAMEVARFRGYGQADIQRGRVQQDLIAAIIKQSIKIQNATKIGEFVDIFAEYVDTDLEVGELLWFAQRMLGIDMENVSFHTMPGDYNGYQYSYTYQNNQSVVLPYGDEILELVNEYFNPYTRDLTKADLKLMQKNRDGSFYVTNGTLVDSRAGNPVPSSGSRPAATPAPTPAPAATERPETTPPGGNELGIPVETQPPANSPAPPVSTPAPTPVPVATPVPEPPLLPPEPTPQGGFEIGIPTN